MTFVHCSGLLCLICLKLVRLRAFITSTECFRKPSKGSFTLRNHFLARPAQSMVVHPTRAILSRRCPMNRTTAILHPRPLLSPVSKVAAVETRLSFLTMARGSPSPLICWAPSSKHVVFSAWVLCRGIHWAGWNFQRWEESLPGLDLAQN